MMMVASVTCGSATHCRDFDGTWAEKRCLTGLIITPSEKSGTMPFEQWIALIGGSAGFLSFLLTLVFWLFPSKAGAGDRFLHWLCTYGPLWPFARVKRAKALGRFIDPKPAIVLVN